MTQSIKIKKLINDLGIDETLTRPVKKPKRFTHVKDNIPLMEDYNFMADLLFLPKDKKGFKYLLVIVDLATDEFDIEPLIDKQPKTVLESMLKIYKRKFVKKPYASLKTDDGNEFKGVFHKWLYDNSIYHSVAYPARHSQMSNVECLNKTLGRIFNGYMNKMEMQTKNQYTNWTDIINIVRDKLNIIRKKKLNQNDTTLSHFNATQKQKYNIGDIVYRKLESPESALGKKLPGNFRMGDFRYDTVPRKIEQVLIYTGDIPYRYILDGFPQVAYAEHELIQAKEQEEEWEVKQILDRKAFKGVVKYLIWWKHFKKSEATWENKSSLIKTIPDMIHEFDKEFS